VSLCPRRRRAAHVHHSREHADGLPRVLGGGREFSAPVKATTVGLGLLGENGFHGARCNAPVSVLKGKWYTVIVVAKGGGDGASTENVQGAHVCVRRKAPLNRHCGLCSYPYALCDKKGKEVTLSRSRLYGPPVHSGNVVGLYISHPPLRMPDPKDASNPTSLKRERVAIKFKRQVYFEALEYPLSKEMLALMDFKVKVFGSTLAPPPCAKKSVAAKVLFKRARGSDSNGDAPVSGSAPLRALPILADLQMALFVNGASPGPAFQPVSLPAAAAAHTWRLFIVGDLVDMMLESPTPYTATERSTSDFPSKPLTPLDAV
jgi:COMPASS component BRE2